MECLHWRSCISGPKHAGAKGEVYSAILPWPPTPNMEETSSGNPPTEGETHPLTGRWLNPGWNFIYMIAEQFDPDLDMKFKFSQHRYSGCLWQQSKESHVKTWRKVTPSHVSRSAFRQNLIWGDGGGEVPVPGQAPLLHDHIGQDTETHVTVQLTLAHNFQVHFYQKLDKSGWYKWTGLCNDVKLGGKLRIFTTESICLKKKKQLRFFLKRCANQKHNHLDHLYINVLMVKILK